MINMFTNEQRAHDLALYMLDEVKNSKFQDHLSLRGDNGSFDFYVEYKQLYFDILEKLNRDFPSND